MTNSQPVPRCPCCGHFRSTGECGRCGGTARALADAPRPLCPRRGVALLDFGRGMATVVRCCGQVLHHRSFLGLLRLPIAANLIAALTLGIAMALLHDPLARLFAEPWPILDGWRHSQQQRGPFALLLTTVWLVWPVWFEVVAGAAADPMVEAAEVWVGGPGMKNAAPTGPGALAAKVHRRARLLAMQVLLLPLAWILALVPFVGLPLVFFGTAATSAAVWLELPAERRGLVGHRHLADLRHNWPRALGYGTALQLAVTVPLVNVLLLAPTAAVAAAVLHFEFEKSQPADEKTPPG